VCYDVYTFCFCLKISASLCRANDASCIRANRDLISKKDLRFLSFCQRGTTFFGFLLSCCLLLCLLAILLSLVTACEVRYRQQEQSVRTQAYRPHESFWRRMRFSVKGIGHVATSGPQSREVICQICKSNKLPPKYHNKRNTSTPWPATGRNRQRWLFHFHSWIIILALTTFRANRRSNTTNQCDKLYPALLSLGLNAQLSAGFSFHGTFPLIHSPVKATQLHQG
jgi:hypothetical protein